MKSTFRKLFQLKHKYAMLISKENCLANDVLIVKCKKEIRILQENLKGELR